MSGDDDSSDDGSDSVRDVRQMLHCSSESKMMSSSDLGFSWTFSDIVEIVAYYLW